MFTIRTELPRDDKKIRNVVSAAFEASEFGHNGEADLVESLRAGKTQYLGLVAEYESQIVAHIVFSTVMLEPANGNPVCKGMGIAPMAVHPEFQNQGIGAQLINAGIERLRDQKVPFVVVLGHPTYYAKFEFEPAASFNIQHGFEGIPQEVFFVRYLKPGLTRKDMSYVAKFGKEFGPQLG